MALFDCSYLLSQTYTREKSPYLAILCQKYSISVLLGQSRFYRHKKSNLTPIFGAFFIPNKVVKPHNGPSAVLVLNGTSHNVIQDAIGFSVFGLAGFPTGFLVDCWKRWSSPQKIILGSYGTDLAPSLK